MSKSKTTVTGKTAREIIKGGEVSGDLLTQYTGKTKALSGAFAPTWTPETAGEQVLGEYIESRIVPKSKNVEKEFPAYSFKLLQWTNGTTFKRQENSILPVEGLVFSIMGKVMDEAMKSVNPGDRILLAYNGLAPKKGKRNPAKLIDVHTLVA